MRKWNIYFNLKTGEKCFLAFVTHTDYQGLYPGVGPGHKRCSVQPQVERAGVAAAVG